MLLAAADAVHGVEAGEDEFDAGSADGVFAARVHFESLIPGRGHSLQPLGVYTNRWLAPDSVGSLTNPGWGKVDLRAQYNRVISGEVNAEFFVDLFNITNNQSAIRTQDLVAGSGGNAFGSEILWVEPRRVFFGTRVKF